MLEEWLPSALWWGPLAFVVYFAISRRTGNLFVFSEYGLYASAANRTEGALPIFLVDGEEAAVYDYTDFVGIDPEAISPDGFQCSLNWRVHEASRWFADHVAPSGSPPGPFAVAYGFRLMRIAPDGSITSELCILQRGTARRC